MQGGLHYNARKRGISDFFDRHDTCEVMIFQSLMVTLEWKEVGKFRAKTSFPK
jgi:hypothetical protein